MKKEFLTPTIETEMLTPQDRVMKAFTSEDNTGSTEKAMSNYSSNRPEESTHWNGFNR